MSGFMFGKTGIQDSSSSWDVRRQFSFNNLKRNDGLFSKNMSGPSKGHTYHSEPPETFQDFFASEDEINEYSLTCSFDKQQTLK